MPAGVAGARLVQRRGVHREGGDPARQSARVRARHRAILRRADKLAQSDGANRRTTVRSAQDLPALRRSSCLPCTANVTRPLASGDRVAWQDLSHELAEDRRRHRSLQRHRRGHRPPPGRRRIPRGRRRPPGRPAGTSWSPRSPRPAARRSAVPADVHQRRRRRPRWPSAVAALDGDLTLLVNNAGGAHGADPVASRERRRLAVDVRRQRARHAAGHEGAAAGADRVRRGHGDRDGLDRGPHRLRGRRRLRGGQARGDRADRHAAAGAERRSRSG